MGCAHQGVEHVRQTHYVGHVAEKKEYRQQARDTGWHVEFLTHVIVFF